MRLQTDAPTWRVGACVTCAVGFAQLLLFSSSCLVIAGWAAWLTSVLALTGGWALFYERRLGRALALSADWLIFLLNMAAVVPDREAMVLLGTAPELNHWHSALGVIAVVAIVLIRMSKQATTPMHSRS